MANKIQFKRGIKATLPVLSVGEPALCTDTGEVFIGGTSGNIGIAKASDLTDYAKRFRNNLIGSTVPDVDLAIETGIYYASNSSKLPVGVQDGSLLVEAYNEDWISSVLIDWRTNSMYTRVKTQGIWTTWKKILNQNDTKIIQDVAVGYDLNNAVESSIIRSTSFLNFPVGLVPDGQGICEVYKYNSGWGKQVFITPHADYTVERIRANNAWLPWHVNFNSGNYGTIIWSVSNGGLDSRWGNKVIYGGGTLTIPANVFPFGTQITFVNWSGTFTFAPASGVYIKSKDSKRIIDGDGASATLIYMDNANGNQWSLIGALK